MELQPEQIVKHTFKMDKMKHEIFLLKLQKSITQRFIIEQFVPLTAVLASVIADYSSTGIDEKAYYREQKTTMHNQMKARLWIRRCEQAVDVHQEYYDQFGWDDDRHWAGDLLVDYIEDFYNGNPVCADDVSNELLQLMLWREVDQWW
jgi:hypothetical protein